MIREIPAHDFAGIFPIRADQSLTVLSDSIRVCGQLEDIVLFEGKVLEGRRRQLAAIRANVKPRYREFGSRVGDGGSDRAAALEYSFQVNICRRDLSEPERSLAAVGYANLRKGFNPNPPIGGLGEKPVSQKAAAAKFKWKRKFRRGVVVPAIYLLCTAC